MSYDIIMRRVSYVKLYAGEAYLRRKEVSAAPHDFLVAYTSYQTLREALISNIQKLVQKPISLQRIHYRHPDQDLQLINSDASLYGLGQSPTPESTISVWFKYKSAQEEFADILELLDHQLTELQKTVHHYHLNPPGRR